MPIAFLPDPVRHKFRAKTITIDGERFDSTGEATRWQQLKILHRAGQIAELRRQVAFDLHAPVAGRLVTIGCYLADFTYYEDSSESSQLRGRLIVEDFKGVVTPLYKWKKRHLELEYALKVFETHDGRRRSRRTRAAR